MTQAELAALPEITGPLFQGPDDMMLIRDTQGVYWMTGWAGGVLYKQRFRLPELVGGYYRREPSSY